MGLRIEKAPKFGCAGQPYNGRVHHGEVTEWFKVHAWNACVRKYREFESHLLRHFLVTKSGGCLDDNRPFLFPCLFSKPREIIGCRVAV